MTDLDDDLRRRLQDHFSDALVTVVGSGHSAALGIPGMAPLASELRDVMPNRIGSDQEEWEAVVVRLDAGVGLEDALDVVANDSPLIRNVVEATAEYLAVAEHEVLAAVLSGSRRLALAELMQHLTLGRNATIVTTNYDRLVEVAVELAGLELDCSFVGMHAGRFGIKASRNALWNRVEAVGKRVNIRQRKHVRLLKPHGSLDWYLREGEPFRTPYDVDLPRLMITPGATKYLRGYERPFDSHREAANHAIDEAARFLTLGFGFNDPHLQTHLAARISAGVPTLMLTHTLTDNARAQLQAGSAVIALERAPNGDGTLVHVDGTTNTVTGDLWALDSFIDEVLT